MLHCVVFWLCASVLEEYSYIAARIQSAATRQFADLKSCGPKSKLLYVSVYRKNIESVQERFDEKNIWMQERSKYKRVRLMGEMRNKYKILVRKT